MFLIASLHFCPSAMGPAAASPRSLSRLFFYLCFFFFHQPPPLSPNASRSCPLAKPQLALSICGDHGIVFWGEISCLLLFFLPSSSEAGKAENTPLPFRSSCANGGKAKSFSHYCGRNSGGGGGEHGSNLVIRALGIRCCFRVLFVCAQL